MRSRCASFSTAYFGAYCMLNWRNKWGQCDLQSQYTASKQFWYEISKQKVWGGEPDRCNGIERPILKVHFRIYKMSTVPHKFYISVELVPSPKPVTRTFPKIVQYLFWTMGAFLRHLGAQPLTYREHATNDMKMQCGRLIALEFHFSNICYYQWNARWRYNRKVWLFKSLAINVNVTSVLLHGCEIWFLTN
jgi:hypothetical protein